MPQYLDLKDPKVIALRNHISNYVTITETLLSKADEMPFTAQFPPRPRTVAAYHESLMKFVRAEELRVAKSYGMTRPQYVASKAKAEQILNEFATGHSMGYRARVLINGRTFASVDNTHKYANSCTWKPTHGHYDINVSKAAILGLKKDDAGQWAYNGKQLKASGYKGSFKVELI